MAKSKIKNKLQITKSAEDLAKALNLPESTAIEWRVRLEVTDAIVKAFDQSDITITNFAKKSGTSRARITRILKRDTSDISLDVLFRILGAAGQQVELKFSKAKAA